MNNQAPGTVRPPSPADPVGEPEHHELARLFGYSHDVLTIMDRMGRVVGVSPSVGRVLGLAPEDVVGERLIHRLDPGRRHGLRVGALRRQDEAE